MSVAFTASQTPFVEGDVVDLAEERRRKRQRVVHPHWESLGSCDECKDRRTRCMRLLADDHTCEACRARGTECLNLRNNGMKYKKRAAKTTKPSEAQHLLPEPGPSKPRPRVQPSHPAFAKWGSCDACHKRRVACVRLQADDATCEECRKRGLTCIKLRNAGLKYKPRAKKAPPVATTESDSSSLMSRIFSDDAHDSQSPPTEPSPPSDSGRILHLSDDSAEGRLALREESSALVGTLLDWYFDTSTFAAPTLRWSVLRERFERAGRRLYQMDPLSETLVRICITFAAYTSDHPLILGRDAPRLEELNAIDGPLDLSQWSLRRAGFCGNLLEEVTELVDRRGVFRISSTETIAILTLVGELYRYTGQFERTYPYRAAALAHLKRMRDEHAPTTDLQAPNPWTLAINDAFSAAVTGQHFDIGDADLDELIAIESVGPPTLDMVQAAIYSARPNEYGPTLASYWAAFIRTCRFAARRVSAPIRKGRHLTLDDWLDCHDRIAPLLRLSISARGIATRLGPLAPPHVAYTQAAFFGASLVTHLEALPLGVVALYFVFCAKFFEWKRGHRVFSEVDLVGGTTGLQALEATLTATLVEGLLFTVHVLRGLDRRAIQSLTSHLSILANVQLAIDIALKLALAVPHAEEGGPSTYSLAIKLDTAQVLVEALHRQGWTFKGKSQAAYEGALAIDALRLLSFSTSLSPPPSPSHGLEPWFSGHPHPSLGALADISVPPQSRLFDMETLIAAATTGPPDMAAFLAAQTATATGQLATDRDARSTQATWQKLVEMCPARIGGRTGCGG